MTTFMIEIGALDELLRLCKRTKAMTKPDRRKIALALRYELACEAPELLALLRKGKEPGKEPK
jgi:hypothetical protein